MRNRNNDGGVIAFIVFALVALLLNVVVWGVVIWAIIQVVSHITS